MRLKAVGNKNPACDFKVRCSLQVEDEMKKIRYCEISVCDSVIIITSTQEMRIKERIDVAAFPTDSRGTKWL